MLTLLGVATAAEYGSYRCQDFIVNPSELFRFTVDEKNHFVNGMLFQLYFNDKGQFEPECLNMGYLKQILQLRKYPTLQNSFTYIKDVLLYFKNVLLFIPDIQPQKVAFDITVREGKLNYSMFEKKERDCYFVDSLRHDTTDILSEIRADKWFEGEVFTSLQSFKQMLEKKYKIPIDFIDLTFNCEINNSIIVIEELQDNNISTAP